MTTDETVDWHRVCCLIAVVFVVVSAVPAPVSADEDGGTPGDLFSTTANADGDENAAFGLATAQRALEAARATLESVPAYLSGARERVSSTTSAVVGSSPTASDRAAALQSAYNDRNQSFEDWVNNQTTASTDFDVIEIRVSLDDETETKYLVATVENGTYTDSRVVNNTSRSVDHWVELEGVAAREAPNDLRDFHDEFVAENETVTKQYMRKMTGKYAGAVRGSPAFLPGGTDTES